MKEKPILFNTEMVKAILDDRKTQTRRVLKVQPSKEGMTLCTLMSTTDRDIRKHEGKNHWQTLSSDKLEVLDSDNVFFNCPYGKVGDRLWVRETFCVCPTRLSYKADHKILDCPDNKWKPSIYMPKKYSRIKLEITDIRVERVQEIKIDDSIAEGIPEPREEKYFGCDSLIGRHKELYFRFVDLWDSINKKRGYGWDKNPWVFVICFKKIT